MSIAFGRQGKCAGGGSVRRRGKGACRREKRAGGGRARAGGETRAGGEKKRVAFSRRPVAQWD